MFVIVISLDKKNCNIDKNISLYLQSCKLRFNLVCYFNRINNEENIFKFNCFSFN